MLKKIERANKESLQDKADLKKERQSIVEMRKKISNLEKELELAQHKNHMLNINIKQMDLESWPKYFDNNEGY